MNKAEMTERLKTRLRISGTLAAEVIDAIFDGDKGIIATELCAARRTGLPKVVLAGFGVFEAKILKGGTRRNPGTGEDFISSDKRIVRFRPGRNLKAAAAEVAIAPTDRVKPKKRAAAGDDE